MQTDQQRRESVLIFSFFSGERVPLGILGGCVPPGSPSPEPISYETMCISTPVFRPGPLKFKPVFRISHHFLY